MKNTILTTTLFLALFLSLSACNPAAPAPDLPTLEGGLWSTACLPISGGGSVKSTLQVSGGAFTTSSISYSDSVCTTPGLTSVASGLYLNYAGSSSGSGSTFIDLQHQQYTIAPNTASQVTILNGQIFCGFNNWALNVAKNVSGLTCSGSIMPSVGSWFYTIYSIANYEIPTIGVQLGDLQFGYTDTAHDGSTVAKRPTSLSANTIYKNYKK